MDWDALIRDEVKPLVPYAPGLRTSEVRERSGRDEIIKLSSNENSCGPFPTAIAAMEAVLPRLNRYPDGAARALRGRLAEKLAVPMENVCLGAGSNEVLRLLAEALVSPGDEVVFAWPSFIVYPAVTQIFGGTQVRVPLAHGEVHDLSAMADAITERTKLVFLCNPNNPTGTWYGKRAFDAFLERIPATVPVVVDEAYFEYVSAADYPSGLDYFDPEGRLVVLRTFSKIYSLAGARIGYGVVPTALARAIDQVREPFNVSSLAQVGAYYSLADEAEVERRRRENQEQKTYLYSCFDRLGIAYVPSETNFVYMKTEKPVEVFEALLAEGIIVRDFGSAPALRVGVGTPAEVRVTCEAFEAVAAKLGQL
jgi:histidinol-phosphate aminotransferase